MKPEPFIALDAARAARWLAHGLAGLVLAATIGCAARSGPTRPAVINHVVFFKLTDPSDADALIRDCDDRLAPIPGVASYFCGRHLDTGRDSVDAAYDVGLYIGFDSDEDYASYVDHADHTWVVAKWRPRLEWILVRDVLDETP